MTMIVASYTHYKDLYLTTMYHKSSTRSGILETTTDGHWQGIKKQIIKVVLSFDKKCHNAFLISK